MTHDPGPRWCYDSRFVVVAAHTMLVTAMFAVTYDPSHDIHVHPCCMLLDFPGFSVAYYTSDVLADIGVLPKHSIRSSSVGQFIAIILGGGLQWLAVAWVYRVWRARRSLSPNLCRQCGYDLTDNVSGTCPECGLKVGS